MVAVSDDDVLTVMTGQNEVLEFGRTPEPSAVGSVLDGHWELAAYSGLALEPDDTSRREVPAGSYTIGFSVLNGEMDGSFNRNCYVFTTGFAIGDRAAIMDETDVATSERAADIARRGDVPLVASGKGTTEDASRSPPHPRQGSGPASSMTTTLF